MKIAILLLVILTLLSRDGECVQKTFGNKDQVWHAWKTGGDKPMGGKSHIDAFKKATGQNNPKCSALGCNRYAKHGAHVFDKTQGINANPNKCWIIGTCAKHNRNPKSNKWNYPMKFEKWGKNAYTGNKKPGYFRPGMKLKPNQKGVSHYITKLLPNKWRKMFGGLGGGKGAGKG